MFNKASEFHLTIGQFSIDLKLSSNFSQAKVLGKIHPLVVQFKKNVDFT